MSKIPLEMLKPMPLEKQKESFQMAVKLIMDKLDPKASTLFSFGIMMGAFESVYKMAESKNEEEVEIPVTIGKKGKGSRKPRGPKKLWSREDDEKIIKSFRMMKPKELGELLGRTPSAVSQRAFVLGLRKQPKV